MNTWLSSGSRRFDRFLARKEAGMTLLNRLKIRTSVLAVVLGAASFSGLVALERVSPEAGRATAVNVDLQSSQQNGDRGGSNGDDGDHDRHCEDGKGKDGEKNKHCRPVSGHQDPCDDKKKNDKKHDDCDEHDGDHGDGHGHGDDGHGDGDHGGGHDDHDDHHGGGNH
jgi:hypothetical protein